MHTTVSASSVLDLLDYCNAQKIPYTAQPEFDRQLLKNPQQRIDEELLITLWKEINQNAKYPEFALLIGQQINPSAKGLLASWVSQAENLAEALNIFLRNIALMNPSEQWHITFNNNDVILEFELLENLGYPIATTERSMSALLAWANSLTRETLIPKSISFNYSQPSHAEKYISIFGKKINFSAKKNQIIFNKSVLNRPITSANAMLKEMIEIKANAAISRLHRSLPTKEKVEHFIQLNLPKFSANIETISNQLGMSRQTLYRKLKEEDCDFKTLLNNVRKKQAITLLAQDDANIYHISLSLGFRETSSFHKAFLRWFEMPPSEYIKRH